MLTPEELAALTAYYKWCQQRFDEKVAIQARLGVTVTTPLSQNAHSAIAKLLEREQRTLHEVELIRKVLAGVSEYAAADTLPEFKNMRASSKRRPHDEVVTEAVHATLAALGFAIRPDGSLVGP